MEKPVVFIHPGSDLSCSENRAKQKLEKGQPLIPYEHGGTSVLGYRLISSCLSTAR